MANCSSAKNMHIANTNVRVRQAVRLYADYVVLIEYDAQIERIKRDELLWKHAESRAKAFFKQTILPEVIGKLFSKSKIQFSIV